MAEKGININGLKTFTSEIKAYYDNKTKLTPQPQTYTITVSVENGNYIGDATVNMDGTASVTITPDFGYLLPVGVIVIGADYTYNSTNGVINLSNAVANVRIDVNCKERTDFLTFSSENNFTLKTANSTKNWNGTIYYSTDSTSWSTWDGTTTLSSNNGKLYLRGGNNTVITGNVTDPQWVLTGSNISISGNIENLLDYTNIQNGRHPEIGTYCFRRWMYHNTALTDCSKLILGSLALNSYCYATMFSGCSNLTLPPILSAVVLEGSCCNSMFYGCTNLDKLPKISALIIRGNSLIYMFQGCTKIKLSTSQTDSYQTPYRIPITGTGSTPLGDTNPFTDMFVSTGGTFTGTPTINTTYYTSNELV